MNIITENRLKHFMAGAIDGLKQDAHDYWLLCMEKYDGYIKAVVSDILNNYEYYWKNEAHYKELSEAVQLDRANWERLCGGLLLCNVIDSQVSYWEDKVTGACESNPESEEARKRAIRQSLIRQLTLASVSAKIEHRPYSWEGRMIADSITRETDQRRERKWPFGPSPSELFRQKMMGQSVSVSGGSNGVLDNGKGFDPPAVETKAVPVKLIPKAIADINNAGLIQETAEGSHVFINQKESLEQLKRSLEIKRLAIPKNKDIESFIMRSSNGVLKSYSPQHIRKIFSKRAKERNNAQ